MAKRNNKTEFFSVLAFVVVLIALLGNGFVARLAAQENAVDVYREIEPIGSVIDIVLREYVGDVDLEEVVEGALKGIMSSLDRNSAFVSASDLEALREETKGEFDGIGVSIKEDDEGRIIVFMPILGSPASEAGLRPFDIITAIDGVSTEGLRTSDAAERIRGRRGTSVTLSILRPLDEEAPEDGTPEIFEVDVKRARIPLESIKEAQILVNDMGYIRISSFSDTTATDLAATIEDLMEGDIRGLILDLRWNAGGLLHASREVCELFLPRNSLVTYTRGRLNPDGTSIRDDMELTTKKAPLLPEDLPLVVLVNTETASAAEIVTGALQYYQRAIVVGDKTYGKGSVQTIFPLERPGNSGLRLTTAYYYTPADVNIDHQGILPDVEVVMEREHELALAKQMYMSFERAPENQYSQNHGSVTPQYEVDEETVEDLPLKRAVEILAEKAPWEDLLNKYHRDIRETQIAAEIHIDGQP